MKAKTELAFSLCIMKNNASNDILKDEGKKEKKLFLWVHRTYSSTNS